MILSGENMKKILLAAAFSAAFVAAPASAQWYAGAGFGLTNTDSNETSLKILGGYQVDRHWGIEAALTDFGSYRGSDAKSVSLAVTGTLPLDRQWALMAKFGVSSNRTGLAGSSDRTEALVGIGVGYTLSRNLGLRLEYEQYGRLADPGSGFNDRADNLALIGKYSF
jgi:OOP family OmpA-OmpF porin